VWVKEEFKIATSALEKSMNGLRLYFVVLANKGDIVRHSDGGSDNQGKDSSFN
jgi:hypothetical protein